MIDGKECAIVGASAVTSGVAHVAVLGGVNKDVFTRALNHPEEGYLTHAPEWYQFNQEIFLYHTITNSWVSEAQSEKIARAGAAVVPYQGSWYVIGGESKPGVRSVDVTEVSMEQRVGFAEHEEITQTEHAEHVNDEHGPVEPSETYALLH